MTEDVRDPGVGRWPGAEDHAAVGGPIRWIATDGGDEDDVVAARTRGERR